MKKFYKMIFVLFILILITGCASMRAKKKEEIITGIKGVVIPVNDRGEIITEQSREKIIINVIRTENGTAQGNSITINPDGSGNFFVKLNEGEYSVEVFLEGFFVKSFNVKLETGEIKDLGKIYLKKIETESATPIKGGEDSSTILNEGDVNIQPPTY